MENTSLYRPISMSLMPFIGVRLRSIQEIRKNHVTKIREATMKTRTPVRFPAGWLLLLSALLILSYRSGFAFDVNGDGREGLAETIHSLRVASGFSPAYSAMVYVGNTNQTAIENGAELLGAVANITDNSSSRPYLVFLEPGIYDLQSTSLLMKPYVYLQGAGRNTTIIISTVSDESWPPVNGTVVLVNNTSLRDLTVRNQAAGGQAMALLIAAGVTNGTVSRVNGEAIGAADQNIGIQINGVSGDISVELEDVIGLAENAATVNCGLRNYYHSILTLRGGSFIGRGGENAYGISNAADDTKLIADGVIAQAESGTYNYGLTNGEAEAMLSGGHFFAFGGTECRGIYSYGTDSWLEAAGITVRAENGSSITTAFENTREARLNGGLFTAAGDSSTTGAGARGIYNRRSTARLYATGVTALAKDAHTSNHGLNNDDHAQARLEGGSFIGQEGRSTSGIYNRSNDDVGGSETRLEAHGVTAIGRDGSISNYGLSSSYGAEAFLYGGSYSGRSDTAGSTGISNNYGAYLEADGITALGEGGGSYNQGLINASDDSVAIIRGGTLMGIGGTFETRGVFTWGSGSSVTASGVSIIAKDGVENYAFVIQSGMGTLSMSTLESVDYTVRNTYAGAGMNVNNSRLVGGDVYGTVTCLDITHNTTHYATTCP